jgi:uncharacterized protein (TIGR04255 family)
MPQSAQHDLPQFDNPPLVETALSVQFERLPSVRSVHFGLFWRLVRDRYPTSQEHPPLSPVVEQFAEPQFQPARLQFEAYDSLSLRRIWLLNSAGTEMMQLQNDRFIKNWRKGDEEQEYPRYEPVIRPAFERDFREFQSFLAAEKLGQTKINQCEVTYVNHVVAGEGWNGWAEIDKVFEFYKQSSTGPFPGRAEDVGFHARFPILGPNKEPIGRLYVEVQPAMRVPDGKPMYTFNLTARGMWGGDLEFLDIGRRWIVKSFERLTTSNMHVIWKKK